MNKGSNNPSFLIVSISVISDLFTPFSYLALISWNPTAVVGWLQETGVIVGETLWWVSVALPLAWQVSVAFPARQRPIKVTSYSLLEHCNRCAPKEKSQHRGGVGQHSAASFLCHHFHLAGSGSSSGWGVEAQAAMGEPTWLSSTSFPPSATSLAQQMMAGGGRGIRHPSKACFLGKYLNHLYGSTSSVQFPHWHWLLCNTLYFSFSETQMFVNIWWHHRS